MPTNYTPNYQLNQWEPEDAVRRVDFNADNAKLDAAIAAVDARVTGVSNSKASASEVNSLRSTVSSLSSTVSGQGVTLGRKGNCQIELISYTGDGLRSRTHTFSRKPAALIFLSDAIMVAAQGFDTALTFLAGTAYGAVLSWSGNSVTVTGKDSTRVIVNDLNRAYRIIAFYDLSA